MRHEHEDLTRRIATASVARRLGSSRKVIHSVRLQEDSGRSDLSDCVLESTDDIAPNRKRYEDFLEAYGQANIDQANEKVLELYNKIRRIKGTYLLRKIDVK